MNDRSFLKKRLLVWVLSLLFGVLVVIVGVAQEIYRQDPLFFFEKVDYPRSPLYYHPRFGNFSRFVSAGLIRSMDYDVIWLGPSYAAPLAQSASDQPELMVTIANLTLWETTKILRDIAAIGNGRDIRIVLSPHHMSEWFYEWGETETAFPDDLYSESAILDYLLGLEYFRIALGLSDDQETRLNQQRILQSSHDAYFWMYEDLSRKAEYWEKYDQVEDMRRRFVRLRSAVTQFRNEKNVHMSSSTSDGVKSLCTAVREASVDNRISIIFPPAHLTYWGLAYPVFKDAVLAREQVLSCFEGQRVSIFDYQSDWDLATKRTAYYDAGHYSVEFVPLIRSDVELGKVRKGEIRDVFARFIATESEFVESQVRLIMED